MLCSEIGGVGGASGAGVDGACNARLLAWSLGAQR
jgi:hypothetical protein